MIQNKQHNQVMITDTKHYVNLQDMLLAVINIITKSNPDTQRYNVGVEFTNFPNVNMHNICWALQEVGYEEGELSTNGWDMDFWQDFTEPQEGFPPLQCSGNGADGVVIVRGQESDDTAYTPLEQNVIYKERIERGNALLKYYFDMIHHENERTGMLPSDT